MTDMIKQEGDKERAMQKEIIISAHSVEQARREGAAMLGVDADSVSYEVIEEAKKGFLGMNPPKLKFM